MADLLGGQAAEGASGGGGAVEAVFWIPDAMTQWRVRGDAWVLGLDVGEETGGARTVRERLGGRMRVVDEGREGEWSWAREVEAHWGNLSPVMRRSFGRVRTGERMGEGEEEGEAGEEEARGNFRVVVVRPMEVERVDLMDEERARRWLYTFVEGDGGVGEWRMEELWP